MTDYNRYKYLKVEKEDAVAVITMDRPEVLNAVHGEMHRELEEVFLDVARDSEARAVVLTGAGRAFCAGGDARGMSGDDFRSPGAVVPLDAARRLVLNMLEVQQPLIAAVNGAAAGLGATLALFCDIIIAAEDARIGDTHVRMGLVAGDGGVVIWPALVGVAKAKEMLLTGDFIDGRKAEQIGLVNKAVPTEEVMPTAMALARRLAQGPARAIRWTKFAINKRLRQEVNLAMDTSAILESITLGSEDNLEAARAFMEKRSPQFK